MASNGRDGYIYGDIPVKETPKQRDEQFVHERDTPEKSYVAGALFMGMLVIVNIYGILVIMGVLS